MDRRSFLNFIKTAGVAAPVAAVSGRLAVSGRQPAAPERTEKILDTRQLNCSYVPYAPFIMKDPNTGQLSGLFYELTETIGELVDLEIKWGLETTYAALPEDMKLKKFDLFAGGLWPEAKQAKVLNYSLPAFYSGLGVYVRADDHRFDANPSMLDDPRFRVATIDGEMSQIVQQSDFPRAAVLGLPDNTDISMLAESVVASKADATIIEKAVANLYMLRNPGSLRSVTNARPIRIFKNTWAFAHGEPRLKNVIDTAIEEMLFSGHIDKVIAKYEQVPGSFYRVHTPVQ